MDSRDVAYVTQEMWDAKVKQLKRAELFLHEIAGNVHMCGQHPDLVKRIDKFLGSTGPKIS